MSVDPSGSGNPVGFKNPPPQNPAPAPSEHTVSSILEAQHERDAPSQLKSDLPEMQKKGIAGKNIDHNTQATIDAGASGVAQERAAEGEE